MNKTDKTFTVLLTLPPKTPDGVPEALLLSVPNPKGHTTDDIAAATQDILRQDGSAVEKQELIQALNQKYGYECSEIIPDIIWHVHGTKQPGMKYTVKLSMGDYRLVGHGRRETIYFLTNYPTADLRTAYQKSCALTGLQFSNDHNYTKRRGTYTGIWTNTEDTLIHQEQASILEQAGVIRPEDFYKPNPMLYYTANGEVGIETNEPVGGAELIMRFIALSMPEDFAYKNVAMDAVSAEPLNGRGSAALHDCFGYGLFCE